MIPKRLAVLVLTLLAAGAISVLPATPASAATPLCTGGGAVPRGTSGDLIVPVVASTNDPTCLIGDHLVGSHAAVSQLQLTMRQCYPQQLAPGFTVDGDWGPITRQTLVNIQNHVHVQPDGIYGPITRNNMFHRSADIPDKCFHY